MTRERFLRFDRSKRPSLRALVLPWVNDRRNGFEAGRMYVRRFESAWVGVYAWLHLAHGAGDPDRDAWIHTDAIDELWAIRIDQDAAGLYRWLRLHLPKLREFSSARAAWRWFYRQARIARSHPRTWPDSDFYVDLLACLSEIPRPHWTSSQHRCNVQLALFRWIERSATYTTQAVSLFERACFAWRNPFGDVT